MEPVKSWTDWIAGKSDREVLEEIARVVFMTRQELSKLHAKVADMETKAQDMMKPEALMDMAGKFLGGRF